MSFAIPKTDQQSSGSPVPEDKKKRRSLKNFFFADRIAASDQKGRDAIVNSPISKSPSNAASPPLQNVSAAPVPTKKVQLPLDAMNEKKGETKHRTREKSRGPAKDKGSPKPLEKAPPDAIVQSPPAQPVLVKVEASNPKPVVPAAASNQQPLLSPIKSKGKKDDFSSTEDSSCDVEEEATPKLTEVQITQQKIVELFDQTDGLEEIFTFLDTKIEGMRVRFSKDYFPVQDNKTMPTWEKKTPNPSKAELENQKRCVASILNGIFSSYQKGPGECFIAKTQQLKNGNDLRNMLLDNPPSEKIIRTVPEITKLWKAAFLASTYAEAELINRLFPSIQSLIELLNKQKKASGLENYFEEIHILAKINHKLYGEFLAASIPQGELVKTLKNAMGKRQEEWKEAMPKLRTNLIDLLQRCLELEEIKKIAQFADYPKMLKFQIHNPMGYHPLEIMVKTLAQRMAPQLQIPRLVSIEISPIERKSRQRP